MHMEFLQYLSSQGVAVSPNVTTGNGMDFLIGRVSYTFGLTGPCLRYDGRARREQGQASGAQRWLTQPPTVSLSCPRSTHTACSSSLVATHLAHSGLLNGEASAAAAAGIFMVLLPGTMSGISQLQALSPVGRCKTFEASGDGYGRGEGCAVAVLQPAGGGEEALAFVHSTVVNQDGRSSSLTAPNGPSQTALVATALQNIGGWAPLGLAAAPGLAAAADRAWRHTP